MNNQCNKCGHEWIGRTDYASCCPACKTRCWEVEIPRKCDVCHRIFYYIICHHIDGNRKNNIPENKLFICIDCHSIIHLGLPKNGSNRIRTYLLDKKIQEELTSLRNTWLTNKPKDINTSNT